MSKVDWSLAPEECTHKDVYEYGLWYKFDIQNDAVYYWSESRGGYWSRSGIPSQYEDGSMDAMVERPSQPKPWSGPEDGLPPVDYRVIVHECTHDYTKRFNGQLVRIVAHDEGKYAVFAADNFEYHALVAEKFKLPPTAEQIAQEARDKAIREMIEVCKETAQSGDFRLTPETVAAFTVRNFGRLVDAGFKREAV